jgi:hypothetical protein
MDPAGTEQRVRQIQGEAMLPRQSGAAYQHVLQFADADSCVAWLETVPLSRATDAHEMVTAQVTLLRAAPLAPLEKLRVLELLYQASKHLQYQLSTIVAGRALPLSIVEFSVWSSMIELWQRLHDAYADGLHHGHAADAELAAHAPLLGLRCIEITGAAVREHHRVYRAVPASLWKQLHDAYASVERQALANCGVADPLNDAMPARTCTGAYAMTLLAHLSNPYTMSPRQMQVTYRWAQLWESLVSVQASPGAPALTSALSVNLRSGQPASAAARESVGPSVRYIVMEQLGQTLRRVLALLRQGHSPNDLGLGDDVRQPGCERLLTLLYIQWCGSGMQPLSELREHGEEMRACVGLGVVARQLASEAEAFRSAGVSARTAYGPLTEHWNAVGINAPGFISVARGPECDTRIRHHQLVAIKRRSATGFQLAVVQWLKLEGNGELSIGLRLLPGLPHVTPLRDTDPDARGDAGSIGVLLPAVPEMRTPATVVLAPGVFSPGKLLELTSGTARTVRLLRLAERGSDFERAVFETL